MTAGLWVDLLQLGRFEEKLVIRSLETLASLINIY